MKSNSRKITLWSIVGGGAIVIGIVTGLTDILDKTNVWIPVFRAIDKVIKRVWIWFFNTSYSIPVWLILLLSVLSAFFVLLLMGVAISSLRKTERSYRDYRQDMVDGVIWKWIYLSDGSLGTESFAPFCPRSGCLHQLEVARKGRWDAATTFTLNCRRCGFESHKEYEDLEEFQRTAIMEAQRKLRTGEYKKLLKLPIHESD